MWGVTRAQTSGGGRGHDPLDLGCTLGRSQRYCYVLYVGVVSSAPEVRSYSLRSEAGVTETVRRKP